MVRVKASTSGGYRASWVATAVIGVLALTGCGASGVSDSTPTKPHSVPTSSLAAPTSAASPADTARQQAVAAYLDMWQDMVHAATTSDWQSPILARNATGNALSTISRGLYADHYNGLVTKGQPVDHPQVSSVDSPNAPNTIVISDCGDDSGWLKYRADNGQPANDGPGGRRQINAIVKKAVDGSWKVTDFGIHGVGTC